MWVNALEASALAKARDATLEILRKGYGYLGIDQFIERLAFESLRIIIFRNRASALVEFVDYENGKLLNILTVHGDIDRCDVAIGLLEAAAKEAGANLVVSIGHMGWKNIMQKHGYYTEKKLLMRKELK
jgi:hypothetical protein